MSGERSAAELRRDKPVQGDAPALVLVAVDWLVATVGE